MGTPANQAQPEVTRLGPYDIVRKLARGGMAELFLARTTGPEGIETLVVLKKILPSHAESPKFVRLFLDEARLAATLDHPHIARVFDTGKADGHYFFTMEHVHGQDVRTTMRQLARIERQFPIEHVLLIARAVASALHYAHERRRPDGTLLGIVHRDVSPSNILVSYEGAVKLVDFGVAKATTSSVKTRTGALKGKIAYMSPEQAKGAPIDRRSDIFSLGIVLWEMVTGRRLFKCENDLATIQRIINSQAQPPSLWRRECPPELDRIILGALANDPDRRYQSAEQLQLELEALAPGQQLGHPAPGLRAYMHDLFAEDILAWSQAQAAGQTLTAYIAEQATRLTAPISESEVYSLDDFELDDRDADGDDPDAAETVAPTTPAAPPALDRPPPASGPAPLVDVSEAPTEIGTLPPLVIPPELPGNPAPFPIAPPEWRPGQTTTTIDGGVATRRTKRILIGSSIAFGVLVLLVALLAGGPPAPRAAEPSAPAQIQMKAVPTSELPAAP